MKRVTLFAGHYGSGKTNIALNYARYLRSLGNTVAIADLDIVNPYFRTKDSADALAREGIRLVVSDYANSNVDFPALPKETYALIADRTAKVVIDVGGDDRGALALGRYRDDILAEGDFDMLAVINGARPLTRTAGETVEVLREIESAGGIPFTGIVNNTNVGPDTTAETVRESLDYAGQIASAMAIPVVMTTVKEGLEKELEDISGVFPLGIQRLYYHLDQ